jgi:hypothetical protein
MNKHYNKRLVEGVVIKLLHHKCLERGMTLIEEKSRCVKSGEIHELVTTDQPDLDSGSRVDRVGFLGFMEVTTAGVVEVGDDFTVAGRKIGTVTGFDACHFPNHYNILIKVLDLITATDIGLNLEDRLAFIPTTPLPENGN